MDFDLLDFDFLFDLLDFPFDFLDFFDFLDPFEKEGADDGGDDSSSVAFRRKDGSSGLLSRAT